MLEDTVATAIAGQPKLRDLYYKMLALYTQLDKTILVSALPVFVDGAGVVFDGARENLSVAKPGTNTYRRDIFDELLFVAHGLSVGRYDESERELFESMSQHVLTSIERSGEVFARSSAVPTVPKEKFM